MQGEPDLGILIVYGFSQTITPIPFEMYVWICTFSPCNCTGGIIPLVLINPIPAGCLSIFSDRVPAGIVLTLYAKLYNISSINSIVTFSTYQESMKICALQGLDVTFQCPHLVCTFHGLCVYTILWWFEIKNDDDWYWDMFSISFILYGSLEYSVLQSFKNLFQFCQKQQYQVKVNKCWTRRWLRHFAISWIYLKIYPCQIEPWEYSTNDAASTVRL